MRRKNEILSNAAKLVTQEAQKKPVFVLAFNVSFDKF